MTYLDADKLLQGRCRNRRKLCNNTYLYRNGPHSIVVSLHATDILEFLADGCVILNYGGWSTRTTADRINRYLPSEWRQTSERGQWFLVYHSWDGGTRYLWANGMTIHPDGTVSGQGDLEEWKERIRQLDRERNKLRYWVQQGRARKRGRLTVEVIMSEPNASVRLAKIHAYGLEAFLLDTHAETIDAENGYELVQFSGGAWFDTIKALKMVCPSTGAVYINAVHPGCTGVAQALDWMYDTKDYLGRIGVQT